MKKQKVILYLLAGLMIFGFIQCHIDKSPLEIEEPECWNTKTTIRDYEYLKNQFFFVDTFYVNYFEKGWTDDLCCWVYNESRLIRVIDVFKSTNYMNPDTIRSLAVVNPQN